MLRTITYNGTNEQECVAAVSEIFGRDSNLGFKFFCNDKESLPKMKDIVILSTKLNIDDITGYERALLIKVAYTSEMDIVHTDRVDLDLILPLGAKYGSDVLFTSDGVYKEGIENICLSLDRYDYMNFTKVAFISKERDKEPDAKSYADFGFRCLIVQ